MVIVDWTSIGKICTAVHPSKDYYTDRAAGLLFWYRHVFFCGRRQRVTVTKAAVRDVLFRDISITIYYLLATHCTRGYYNFTNHTCCGTLSCRSQMYSSHTCVTVLPAHVHTRTYMCIYVRVCSCASRLRESGREEARVRWSSLSQQHKVMNATLPVSETLKISPSETLENLGLQKLNF